MTPIKVFGIFLSIIFLLSCTITPKKIDKDLAIQRIDIYPISSTDTFEESINSFSNTPFAFPFSTSRLV